MGVSSEGLFYGSGVGLHPHRLVFLAPGLSTCMLLDGWISRCGTQTSSEQLVDEETL